MTRPNTSTEPKRRKVHNPALTNFTVFLLLLTTGGVLSLVLPKSKISEAEKRTLTPFPRFSVEQLFQGNFTDSLDLFYSDNFPFREPFVDVSGALNQNFGYRANDMRIYKTKVVVEESTPIVAKDSLAAAPKDSVIAKAKAPRIDSTKAKVAELNSIVIYQGRAFQMFNGSVDNARNYAEVINKYQARLGDSAQVYCLIAPTPIDFYLPLSNKRPRNLEGPNIDTVHAHLDSLVLIARAYDEIAKHTNEYVFFNTDHHWTALGAYYAYRSFCDVAGLEAFDLSRFERRVRKRYLGSLYDMTKDLSLKQNKDSVVSYRVPQQTTTWRYITPKLDSVVKSKLFVEIPTYAMFLGGDHPLIHIETEIDNDRRLLVVKDSYGNAVVPFLTMHFSDVYVVDYRYFERNLVDFSRRHKITDVIFLHNTFVVNTRYTAERELYLMRIWERRPVLPDSVKKASNINDQDK
jgi:hypothetical protein